MILLDTNVLVYALGQAHPLREPSRRLLDGVARGRLEATTVDVVIVEFLHVFAARRPRGVAGSAARDYAELLGPLLAVTQADVALAVDLFERHADLDAADALIAAAALNHSVDAVVSADRAYASVPGLRALDPRAPEADALLPE